MANIYSVGQVNTYIKNMFVNDFFLKQVMIKGEVSNVKYHSSGHIYFSLKDSTSTINAVMFKGSRVNGLNFNLENGQSVVISGSINVYERDGRYQIYASNIALDGSGELYLAYEKLKNRLYEEGLFEFDHKKTIPKFPKRVGIVTAPTGAAIEDIKNIAKRRNPFVQLILYPAKVQGDKAAQTIVKGIKTLDDMGVDTIIIGRGGGSIEDLWCFNEEIVARAIYEANTPIISGTGHEIDNTIADYVSDLRAPTPSAACELALYDVVKAINELDNYGNIIKKSIFKRINIQKLQIDSLEHKLNTLSPVNRLNNQKMYADDLAEKLENVIHNKFLIRKHKFEILTERINGLSPTAKLINGFGYIESGDRNITSVLQINVNDNMKITINDGIIKAKVTDVVEGVYGRE